MKLCRAWPEYCLSNSKVEEPVKETEFFPKDFVESKVRERLQLSIDKAIKDVVVEDDPKPVREAQNTAHQEPSAAAAAAAAASAAAVITPNAAMPSAAVREGPSRDLWIFVGVFSLIFMLLLSSLYNRISILEKVIFESH